MTSILVIPNRQPVLDHPWSATSNGTARINTTHQQMTTAKRAAVRGFDVLSRRPRQPIAQAWPANEASKATPNMIAATSKSP